MVVHHCLGFDRLGAPADIASGLHSTCVRPPGSPLVVPSNTAQPLGHRAGRYLIHTPLLTALPTEQCKHFQMSLYFFLPKTLCN